MTNGSERIAKLEEMAAAILKIKQENRPKRPIVIEFCGTPKSGKTTSILSLNTFLKRNNFKTRVISERASVCPISDKYNPNFNFWNMFRSASELIEWYHERSKKVDVIICDRGYFDCLCWFKWFESNKHISTQELQSIVNFTTMKYFSASLDLIFALKASPETALSREYVNLLTTKHGSIMNAQVIQEYNNCLEVSIQDYESQFRYIDMLETDNVSQLDLNFEVTSKVLEKLHEMLNEKIAYFSVKDLSAVFHNKFMKPTNEFNELKVDYLERSAIEQDSEKVQLVSVAAIIDRSTNKIFCVKKKQENVNDSSPERAKTLLYVGGHVRKEDFYRRDIDHIELAKFALIRELNEEIGVSSEVETKNAFLIWDRDNPRSKKHLCVVFPYYVDSNHFTARISAEFESSKKSGQFVDPLTINPDNVEAWSREILERLLNINTQQISLWAED